MRGSPHSHGLYWITNAPEYREDDETSVDECVNFIDQFITTERNTDAHMDILIGYQLHKHTFTCQKTQTSVQKCRFGFPLPPFDKTEILAPLSKHFSKECRNKAGQNFRRIKDYLENLGRSYKEDLPFNTFLEILHISRDDYVTAIRSSIKRTTVFLKRSTNSIYMNAYNKKLLEAWGANIDFQFILDAYACAKYCVSYIFKSEGGVSKLLRKLSEDIRRGNISAQHQLKQFGNILINGSEISAQEASAFLLGIPNTYTSKSDIFINTGPPNERVSILKSKKELEALAEGEDDVFQKNLLDHYIKRPDELEECTLAEFASCYDFSESQKFRNQESRCEDDSTPHQRERETGSMVFALKDDCGFVKRRKKRKIIRYRHYSRVQQMQNYCREHLMLFLPWRDEITQLLNINHEAVWKERLQLITLNSAHYIHSQMIQEFTFEAMLDEIAEEDWNQDDFPLLDHELEHLENEPYISDILEDLGGYKTSTFEQFLPPRMITDEVYVNLMRSLNEKQRKFVLNTLHLIKVSKQPMYHFLTGGAGVGKSHVITAIVQSLLRHAEKTASTTPEQVPVIVSAPTGKAAFNVFGMTLHCTFKLPPTQYAGKLNDLEPSALNTLRTKLMSVKLFIIDQISMVSVTQFYYINQRLQQIFANENDFGGISILVVGHFRQLPPVMGSFVFKVPHHLPLGNCTGNYLWDRFQLFELDEIMRQKGDYQFCKALNNMAEGCMDEDDVALLKSREIRNNLHPNAECIRLFHTNAQCKKYNDEMHAKLGTEGVISNAYDRIQGRGSSKEKEALKGYAKDFSLQKSDGLPYRTNLEVGGEYFISTNVDVEDGLFNGSTGQLKAIDYGYTPSKQKLPTRVYMDFRNPIIGNKMRQNYESIYNLLRPGLRKIDNRWTPIHKVKRNLSKTRTFKGMEVIREQFPLIAANGMTIAKSQGSSYPVGVVLCVTSTGGRKITRELLYVGCSRSTSSDGLYIDGQFEPPPPPPDNDPVTVEIARMRSKPFQFNLTFLQDLHESYRKVYYHNIQSLKAHYNDIVSDRNCMAATILAFVEPHMLKEDDIAIADFRVLHRVNCVRSRNSEGSIVLSKVGDIQYSSGFNHQTFAFNGGHCIFTRWMTSSINLIMIYKSPDYPKMFFQQHLKPMLHSVNGEVVVFGDINLNISKGQHNEIVNIFNEFGLTSKIDVENPTTESGSHIDCCFSNTIRNILQFSQTLMYLLG